MSEADVVTSTNGTSEIEEKVVPASQQADPTKTENGAEKNGSAEKAEEVLTPAEEANRAFLQGKRDLAIRDYPAAVASLAKACELLGVIYGESGDELGDAYFYYGKALFANARAESAVLGDKIDQGKDSSDDDDDTEEADDDEGGAVPVDEGEKKTGNGKTPAEAQPDQSGGGEGQEDGQDGQSGEGGDQDDEDVCDDLQLSWESLEMAKLIYQRKADEDKETAIKLSEVYLTLGENALESERYAIAVSDMETCLKIQQENLRADDRRIAETYYQLGMAHAVGENYDGAINNFELSITQLKKRLSTLEGAKSEGKKCPDGEVKDSFYSVEGEITEISDVIKDLRDKVTDMAESKKHRKIELAKKLGFLGEPSNGASSSSAPQPSSTSAISSSSTPRSSTSAFSSAPASSEAEAKPVSNISHLVRKKRKNEDEEVGSSDKKPKTEDDN